MSPGLVYFSFSQRRALCISRMNPTSHGNRTAKEPAYEPASYRLRTGFVPASHPTARKFTKPARYLYWLFRPFFVELSPSSLFPDRGHRGCVNYAMACLRGVPTDAWPSPVGLWQRVALRISWRHFSDSARQRRAASRGIVREIARKSNATCGTPPPLILIFPIIRPVPLRAHVAFHID